MSLEGPTSDDLERQKLLLEIRELQWSWWQRPSYIAAFLPAILGGLTLFVGYKTGYFNAVSERLAAQRLLLDRDVKDFTNQKEHLVAEVTKLSAERDTLSAETVAL